MKKTRKQLKEDKKQLKRRIEFLDSELRTLATKGEGWKTIRDVYKFQDSYIREAEMMFMAGRPTNHTLEPFIDEFSYSFEGPAVVEDKTPQPGPASISRLPTPLIGIHPPGPRTTGNLGIIFDWVKEGVWRERGTDRLLTEDAILHDFNSRFLTYMGDENSKGDKR